RVFLIVTRPSPTPPLFPYTTLFRSAAAAAALGLRPGLVDDEVAVAEETTVEHLDRLGRLLLGRHLDEAKTPRPAGELIGDDPYGLDRPRLGEELAQVLLRCLERQVPYE